MSSKIMFIASGVVFLISVMAVGFIIFTKVSGDADTENLPLTRQMIIERFSNIPGLLDWSIKEALKLEHDGLYLLMFYTQLCAHCDHTKALFWLQDNVPELYLPILILHPSHKPHDLSNIRINLSLHLDAVILSKRFEKDWNELMDRTESKSVNGILLIVDNDGDVIRDAYIDLYGDSIVALSDLLNNDVE